MDHKTWIQQAQAAQAIRDRFGTYQALEYLVGEKLTGFVERAKGHPEYAKELPCFLATVGANFSNDELQAYIAKSPMRRRKKLREIVSVIGYYNLQTRLQK